MLFYKIPLFFGGICKWRHVFYRGVINIIKNTLYKYRKTNKHTHRKKLLDFFNAVCCSGGSWQNKKPKETNFCTEKTSKRNLYEFQLNWKQITNIFLLLVSLFNSINSQCLCYCMLSEKNKKHNKKRLSFA